MFFVCNCVYFVFCAICGDILVPSGVVNDGDDYHPCYGALELGISIYILYLQWVVLD